MTLSYNRRKKFHNKLKILSSLMMKVENFIKYKKSKKSAEKFELNEFTRTTRALNGLWLDGFIPPAVMEKHQAFIANCNSLVQKVYTKQNASGK